MSIQHDNKAVKTELEEAQPCSTGSSMLSEWYFGLLENEDIRDTKRSNCKRLRGTVSRDTTRVSGTPHSPTKCRIAKSQGHIEHWQKSRPSFVRKVTNLILGTAS